MKFNWIKMYDKGTVLRVETVINNPEEFRVRRRVRRQGRDVMAWVPLRKSVTLLFRYVHGGQAQRGRLPGTLRRYRLRSTQHLRERRRIYERKIYALPPALSVTQWSITSTVSRDTRETSTPLLAGCALIPTPARAYRVTSGSCRTTGRRMTV